MSAVILEHHRSRRRILITNAVTIVMMFPFLGFLAYVFNFDWLVVCICLALLMFNLAIYTHMTCKVLSQPHDFSCTLFQDRIRCYCPDDTMGATFDVPLTQLRAIRRDSMGEGQPRFYLVTSEGVEYWLTGNFGNPAAAFAAELRARCPGIEWAET